MRRFREFARVIAASAVIASATAAVAVDCFDIVSAVCCTSTNVYCSSGQNVWYCASSTSGSINVNSSVGGDTFKTINSAGAGACNTTPSTCGASVNECVAGAPVAGTCTTLSGGQLCTNQGGGGEP